MPTANTAAPKPLANMGDPIVRSEAAAKVTGKPLYASDMPVQNPLHAYFLTSAIALGRIASIDTAPAEAMSGVFKIYTHHNAPKRQVVPHFTKGGPVSDSNMPLVGPDIYNDGQIIAMVLAESYEIARDASRRIVVRYDARVPAASLDSPTAQTVQPPSLASKDKKVGDFETAFAQAPVKIDQEYRTPPQHHNPMELFATTASWSGDMLTLYEPSQFVYGLAGGLSRQLGVDQSRIHVVNPYVGGAFGSKGVMTQRTALIAQAAREVGRPVKLVIPRDQGFSVTTYRAETRHRVRLAADKKGKLVAYGHEGWEVTSRLDDYSVAGTEKSVEMYDVPNISTRVQIVKADRNTPGFMRSPPEVPYMYALESAMDELAVALEIDPVELRRINDTMKSPVTGAPYTSRSLMECFDQASSAFGWKKRNPRPASMRDGDWLIGYGCATATYPTNLTAAAARVILTADGKAHVEIAAHDVGTGAYTAMGQIAARRLGIDPVNVTVAMGDSKLPPAPVAGGSMTTASAGSAVHGAADKIVARFGGTMPKPGELTAAFRKLGTNRIEEYAEWAPPGSPPDAVEKLSKGSMSGGGGNEKKPLMAAFGAQFVEVRIHRLTREIRVPRMTGAFAAGRIVNPRTTHSQYLGGMIWGMASALLEATEIDEKRARYVNDNIAEYLIAVNADIPQVDIIMVPEVDTQVNPIGVKGVGELANVGTAAAIANAVYHATGMRIRDLPITMDKLLV